MKRPLLSLLLAAATLPIAAHHEGGAWFEAAAEKNLSSRFSVEGALGHRLEDNFSQPSRWDASIGLSYKATPWLKLSGGQIFIRDYNAEEATPKYNNAGQINGYNVDAPFWRNKLRSYFDATLKHKFSKRWSISLRERYQYTHNLSTTAVESKYRSPLANNPGHTGAVYTYNGTDFTKRTEEVENKRSRNRHYLRSRIGVEYDIKGLPLDPYFTYEMTNNLTEKLSVVRHRFTLGTDWKITKKHVLSMGYLYQTGTIDKGVKGHLHVLDIGYKFKF